MPLYPNYVPTYQPNSAQMSPGAGNPLQNPLYASNQSPDMGPPLGAGPMSPLQNSGSYTGPNGLPQMPSQGGGPGIGFNTMPMANSPWATPASTPGSYNIGAGGMGPHGGGGAGGGFSLGTSQAWANPFQPVQDYLSKVSGGNFSQYGPQNGSSQIRYGQPQGQQPMSPFAQQEQGWNNGAAMDYSGANQLFGQMNEQQLGQINPYALQSSFGMASQNYANAYANPAYTAPQGIPGTGPANGGAPGMALGGAEGALNQAYQSYVNQMNAHHLF